MSTPHELARPGRPQPGVINDLGYRHYDGPRLGRRHIARALFLESAKGAYGLGRSVRSKIMPMLLLAAVCLPALIIAAIAALTPVDELPVEYTSYVLNVQLLVMIYVAGQAPASVSRDLRFRVVSLYFSRPLERVDYVAAKYAAMTAALFVFLTLPLTILFAGALLAELPIGEQVPDYLRSLAGCLILALVLAGAGLVIAAVTPRRGLGVAAIIAVLFVLSGVQAAVQAIAVEEGRDTVAGYAGLISPFTLVDGVQHVLLGAVSELPADPPGTTGALVFTAVAVAVVAGCLAILLLRYRRVAI
jgi:ABC-2 type transport system permease protein